MLIWVEIRNSNLFYCFCASRQEMEPIGDGPQYNKGGTADVTADLHNNHLSYSITADDFVREKEKTKLKTATNAARQVE